MQWIQTTWEKATTIVLRVWLFSPQQEKSLYRYASAVLSCQGNRALSSQSRKIFRVIWVWSNVVCLKKKSFETNCHFTHSHLGAELCETWCPLSLRGGANGVGVAAQTLRERGSQWEEKSGRVTLSEALLWAAAKYCTDPEEGTWKGASPSSDLLPSLLQNGWPPPALPPTDPYWVTLFVSGASFIQ